MNQLDHVFSKVFGESPTGDYKDWSQETNPAWDSLRQLDLAFYMEETFHLVWNEKELGNLTSYEKIQAWLESQGQ